MDDQHMVNWRKTVDQKQLKEAKQWYRRWTGRRVVLMDDNEIVDIFNELHSNKNQETC